MDYSKLSDKEINKQVAFALGCKEVMPDIFMDDSRRYEFDKPKKRSGNQFYFDPCNNPADAWPIIHQNLIALKPVAMYVGGHRWFATKVDADVEIKSANDNPLRAAMEIFLMMQEAK
ncbi:DUF2591 domain-containing protein [Klebsiella aerogenes]|uniref:phage protein NinX family protein n=1 Tax=Klebsiella aerogenes TaxID=548 RepID=UPI002DBDCC57|nr:phage protein NinX family protein [Klebsiella aerogenes]MEB6655071.1 DUF2591 domain-containing protein [Klebsiella aerogenes]